MQPPLPLCVFRSGSAWCYGNCDAIKQVELHNLIHSLPGLYSVIGDCAYTPSEKLIPIYRGAGATLPWYDNFNFFAS
jgi:hypothetical protein